jgi:hypothetical protein
MAWRGMYFQKKKNECYTATLKNACGSHPLVNTNEGETAVARLPYTVVWMVFFSNLQGKGPTGGGRRRGR